MSFGVSGPPLSEPNALAKIESTKFSKWFSDGVVGFELPEGGPSCFFWCFFAAAISLENRSVGVDVASGEPIVGFLGALGKLTKSSVLVPFLIGLVPFLSDLVPFLSSLCRAGIAEGG